MDLTKRQRRHHRLAPNLGGEHDRDVCCLVSAGLPASASRDFKVGNKTSIGHLPILLVLNAEE
jgi:hypothetical protein